jgi:hypothetical protein
MRIALPGDAEADQFLRLTALTRGFHFNDVLARREAGEREIDLLLDV